MVLMLSPPPRWAKRTIPYLTFSLSRKNNFYLNFDAREFCKFIKMLDSTKAPFPDKIAVAILKKLSPDLSPIALRGKFSMEGISCLPCFKKCGGFLISFSISTHRPPECYQETLWVYDKKKKAVDHLNRKASWATSIMVFGFLCSLLMSSHNILNH